MKTFLVVNPQSANGATGRKWAEISAQVNKTLGDFEHAFTEAPLDAARLTQRALEEGYDCIVAVGGDGTVNEVVNGFFRQGRIINDRAALGVLPRGTGGDFRRTFGWESDVGSNLHRLKQERTAPLDIGLIEYTQHDGQKAQRYFANIASFGVSGQVDREVNNTSKALGGKLSFMVGSVRALMKYADRRVRLCWDDHEPEEMDITAVAVAIGRYFGGGMMVAPQAQVSDGLFDVTIWSGYRLSDFAFKSKSIYDGSHVKLKGTRQFRCNRLEAHSDQEVLLDVDGEQPGRLPCAIRILPSALQLRV